MALESTNTTTIDEAELWAQQQQTAETAFAFWRGFLGLRGGPANDQALTAEANSRWMCIIRAVSWVESRHGTGSGHQPARDPIQCGNPADAWWRTVTNQSGNGDRFVRGPGMDNLWANELVDAIEPIVAVPEAAKLSTLADRNQGHRDPAFNAWMSYYWGIPFLIQRTNTHPDVGAGRATYKCDDSAISRLVNGAVAYNGGGSASYRTDIEAALARSGCAGTIIV